MAEGITWLIWYKLIWLSLSAHTHKHQSLSMGSSHLNSEVRKPVPLTWLPVGRAGGWLRKAFMGWFIPSQTPGVSACGQGDWISLPRRHQCNSPSKKRKKFLISFPHFAHQKSVSSFKLMVKWPPSQKAIPDPLSPQISTPGRMNQIPLWGS